MRLAVIDLGSNSFHLVVVDVDRTDEFVPVTRHKEILGLGAVVARHGFIPPADAERACQTFRRLLILAHHAGAQTVLACATAAIRQAANGPALVAAMEAGTGVAIRVLDGEEEAGLVFGAVLASTGVETESVVCLDVGGGSLEVAVGGRSVLPQLASLDLGAGRLTAELVRHDPPTPGEMQAVRDRVTDSLAPVVLASPGRPTLAIGTGGVARDLARLIGPRRPGTAGRNSQTGLGLDRVRQVEAQLYSLSASERERLGGIKRGRAGAAAAGATVFVVAMECFGVTELTVAACGVREGIILEYLGHVPPARLRATPESVA